ncbi:MAG: hypothetical protein N2Z22_12285, partial [Turneriella sp.]|nr:hypothetical protein [Turneriella sp.]
MPSCAYELKGSAGTFTIDRDGVIRDLAGREVSAEELLREEDLTPDAEAAPDEGYAVELPLAGHTA